MWDGRETVFGDIPQKSINLVQSLTNQANDATVGHAQGAPPTAQQLADIVAFETGLFTAQVKDESAGDLTARGAAGGPVQLSTQEFYVGINDSLEVTPTVGAFRPMYSRSIRLGRT